MDFQLIARTVAKTQREYGSSSRESREVAQRLGLVLLASGCFGAAYLHEKTGLVLKVSFGVSDGSMAYIAKCAEHFRKHGKAAPFTPEVYAFGRERRYWWAWMECVDTNRWCTDAQGAEAALLHFLGGRQNLVRRTRRLVCHDDVCWDLHPGNYGHRKGTDKIVVFDPFGSYTHVREFPKARCIVPKKQHGPSQGRWA